MTDRQIADFPCLELVEPAESELRSLGDRFDLHELAIEDAVKAHQRPKLERYGDNRLLVLKQARYDDGEEAVAFGEVQLMFGERFLVIVRHGSDGPLDLDTEREPASEGHHGPGVLVHRIVDQIVDGYAPVIAGFENDVLEVEETVFAPDDIYPTERIYRLKGQLLTLLHNVRPLIEPIRQLHRDPMLGDGLMEYFRDVEDHLERVTTRIERASELMSEMLDANLARVGNQQNEDMRKMSAWAAVFLVPTVLAGIWGMNFQTMPELEWSYGYPIGLLVMAAVTGLVYWKLKRSGWL